MSFLLQKIEGKVVTVRANEDGTFIVHVNGRNIGTAHGPTFAKGMIKTGLRYAGVTWTEESLLLPEYDEDFIIGGTEGTGEYIGLLSVDGSGKMGVRVGPASSLYDGQFRIRVDLAGQKDLTQFNALAANGWKTPTYMQRRYSAVVSTAQLDDALRLAATALMSGLETPRINQNVPEYLAEVIRDVYNELRSVCTASATAS